MQMTATRGYTANKSQLLDRLARIEGQIRGVSQMVEKDRYCTEVLTQLNAAQAAIDKVSLGLLDAHARHCLLGEGEGPKQPDQQVDELMDSIGRMLSRKAHPTK
jgi:CsoR family transcriptional regulator, copper-sensing transcriptional repressor